MNNSTIEMKAYPNAHVRILLIDDDVIVADLTKEIFTTLGYLVVAKRSSIEAWDAFYIDPNKFDLVITDHNMPGLSGDLLAERIKRLRHDIPILLCTGYGREDCKDLLFENLFSAIFYKPFELGELVEWVSEALGKPHSCKKRKQKG